MAYPICPSYHTPMMESATRKELIRHVKRYLKHNPDVVAIAGTGLSGIPIVAIISHLTGLAPIYVRSKGAETHDTEFGACTSLAKGDDRLAGRYVILDDLVDSGETLKYITNAVSKLGLFENSNPKAALLYRSGSRTTRDLFQDGSVILPMYYVGAESYYDEARFDPKKIRSTT